MKPDRYIRAATAGLPPEQRLERASELRSHYLEGVRVLTAEGYSRHEAEELALAELGPIHNMSQHYWRGVVNRFGWIVFWPLLLGAVAFGAWWFLIPRPTGVTLFDPHDRSFDQGYRVTLPEGTELAEVAFIVVDGSLHTTFYPDAFAGLDEERPTFRDQLLISGGVQIVDTDSECLDQFELRTELGSGRDKLCHSFAREVDSGQWSSPARGLGKLESGRWVPIGAFQAAYFEPEIPKSEREVGDVFQAIPFEWVGVMVYLGSEDPPEDPPAYAELPSIFPGLSR